MACLTNQEIERLAAEPDDPADVQLRAHLHACPSCCERLAQVRGGGDLVADIKELHKRREAVRPLTDGVQASDKRLDHGPGDSV